MGDDKHFNHAFKYYLNEQVWVLCNIFILFYFSSFSAIGKVYWGDNHVGSVSRTDTTLCGSLNF
jgi:hypothetical protein